MAYATIDDVRELQGLDDDVTYPDAVVEDALAYAEELIDNYCEGSFEEKPFVRVIDPPSGPLLRLSDVVGLVSITSVTDARGTQIDVSGWGVPSAYDSSVYAGWLGFVCGPLTVRGTANGTPDGVPAAIHFAAKHIAGQQVKETLSRVSDRTLSVANEFGMSMLAQAGGANRPTSMPEVNAALTRHRFGVGLIS